MIKKIISFVLVFVLAALLFNSFIFANLEKSSTFDIGLWIILDFIRIFNDSNQIVKV